jgi:flagellar biosynthesis protein FlhB
MADAQNRNLPASQRRIAKARSEGQIARSRDLAYALPLAVGALGLAVLATPAASWARQGLAAALRFDARDLASSGAMVERLASHAQGLLLAIVPTGALLFAASMAAGWNFTWKPLAPKFSKLDPIAGLGRLLSPAHLGDTVKAVLLALVLGGVGAAYLAGRFGTFHDALTLPLPAALQHVAGEVFGGLLLLLAALGGICTSSGCA